MSYLLWAIVLLVVGLGLAVVELFIPSAGMLGILAFTALIASIVMAFFDGAGTGVAFMAAIVFAVPICISLAIKVWPHTRMGKRVLLPVPTTDEVVPDDDERRWLRSLVGMRAVAKSKMLPSGVITCNGRTIDATTEGMAVEPGQVLRIVAVHGTRVIVRPLDEENGQASEAEADDVLSQPLDKLGIDPDAGPLG